MKPGQQRISFMSDNPALPCTCATEEQEPLPCPYDQDINNETVFCLCCDACRYECAMDI